ncbi:hypothetical protein [Paenibacillus larvae]|uniref:hypothetical protein n=1 Tax=Paenibacillus larvae TaxID=1464 RepID=UPI002890582B|nr:hypothetical protein [Paenibacillus larvae]MDT2192970.1 hypothetical protein [Paenibacillus larvae]MDT2236209.1 hypothetical protein [Paenibacillus larvae]
MVIRDNHSIKHIYDAHQEEEAVFTCLRMSTFYLALTDAIHSFACISDILFLVDHESMLAPQDFRQLTVSISRCVLVGQQFHDPFTNLFIANRLSILCT